MRLLRLSVFVLLFLLFTSPGSGQPLTHVEGLGSISFPTSGGPEAQPDFIRGVLLLHSFEYGQAAEFFRSAQALDPNFAMAFWGEAMSFNSSLWRDKDEKSGREVLSRLPGPQGGGNSLYSERENMYLEAVKALYAEGLSKTKQDWNYMEAMLRLHEAYPEDDEARSFYALSILGSRNGERDFATYMKAAATVGPVFERNADHPGAAHYLIHSFDDPVHAPLGLPAALAYSEIAPDAGHAQHMTSHIFLAMGMWDRVVTANIRAQGVSDAFRAERGLPPVACGHYTAWLHYGRLMTNAIREAEALMDACHARATSGDANPGELFYFATMRARHVVDTENWSLTDRWKAELPRTPEQMLQNVAGVFGGPQFTYRLTDAFADLFQGNSDTAASFLQDQWEPTEGRTIQIKQLEGALLIRNGNVEAGIALLREASALEDALPFEYGPPEIVKPAAELLGEALLKSGQFDDAVAALQHAVDRTPGRTLAGSALSSAQAARSSR